MESLMLPTQIVVILTSILYCVAIGTVAVFIPWSLWNFSCSLPRRRWFTRWWFRIGMTLAILFTAGWFGADYWFAKALRDELERIRAAGEPVTFSEIAPGGRQRDPADAAPYYEAAIALLRTEFSEDQTEMEADRDVGALSEAIRESLQPGAAPLDPKVLADARRVLELNRTALDLADHAAGLETCNFDLHPERGMGYLITPINRMMRFGSLYELRAFLELADGNEDAALESILALIKLSRTLEHNPVLVAEMVRVAVLTLAQRPTIAFLEHGNLSDEALRRITDTLVALDREDGLHRVLFNERVYSIAMVGLEIPGLSPPPGPMPETWPAQMQSGPFTKQIILGPLLTSRAMIEAARKPFPQKLGALRDTRHVGTLGEILVHAFTHAAVLEARSLAELRAVRIAIACELHRRKTGSLPDTLPDVDGQTLLDPFDGKPMKFKRDGDALLIYSVGEDGQDNGGAIDRADDGKPPPDCGFRVRLPSP